MKLAVKRLDGIYNVEASYEESKVVVDYEPAEVTPEEIVAAIENVGFKANLRVQKEPSR